LKRQTKKVTIKWYQWLLLLCLSVFQAKGQFSADSLYQLGNYSAAINEYAKVGSLEAEHQIARAYNAIGNYDKAILQYQAIIKKDTSNFLTPFELGKLYDKTKKFEESEVIFKDLTRKSTDNPEFFYYLGKAQQRQLDYDNANRALHQAVLLDSTHLRSIYLLGKYYVGVEEPSNAHKILDVGLRTAPNDLALIYTKSWELPIATVGSLKKRKKPFVVFLKLKMKNPMPI